MKYIIASLILSTSLSACATAKIDIEVNNYTCLVSQYCNITAKYYNHITNDTNVDQDYCVDLQLCVQGFGCGKKYHECGIRTLPRQTRMIGKEINFNRTYDYGQQCFQIEALATVTSNDGTNVTERGHSRLCIW